MLNIHKKRSDRATCKWVVEIQKKSSRVKKKTEQVQSCEQKLRYPVKKTGVSQHKITCYYNINIVGIV